MDRLASTDDPVWPNRDWPRMRLDRPLALGASGGHGPIRYFVEAYEPGRSVRFRFTAPRGFDGAHMLELLPTEDAGATLIRHTLTMSTSGLAGLSWSLAFRPLHDALLEDALDRAEVFCGGAPDLARWSLYVRFLRKVTGLAGRHRSGANSSRR